MCFTIWNSLNLIFPAPAPPVALPIVVGFEAPHEKLSTSISPLCLSSVDSPSIPSSFRNASNGIYPSSTPLGRQRNDELDVVVTGRPAAHRPFDERAGRARVSRRPAEDGRGHGLGVSVRSPAHPEERSVLELHHLKLDIRVRAGIEAVRRRQTEAVRVDLADSPAARFVVELGDADHARARI